MKSSVDPGEQLDHYRIEGVVARTVTASIFRATDLQTNQPVAIEIPHPEMEGDPVSFDRFHREEEIGKTLDHAGLLKVLPSDHHSQVYMVTEWFDGKRLRHLLNEQSKLPAERAIRITFNVCDVLTYIHNHGIVHRNLKPENILIDDQDHIKLINFGVAGKTGAKRITFTNLSQVTGISEYLSPEELNGKRGDERSDIYALGVILYEMLTGKTPFHESERFDRIVTNPVPPRELDPSISPQLQEVIYRALERQHKDRYASAHEFSSDLTDLDRVTVAERRELRGSRKRRSPRLRKFALYLAIALAPIAIFALLLWFARS